MNQNSDSIRSNPNFIVEELDQKINFLLKKYVWSWNVKIKVKTFGNIFL